MSASPRIVKYFHAVQRGSMHYFTGKPCRRGHIALRRTSSRQCIECERLNGIEYRTKYRDQINERRRRRNAPVTGVSAVKATVFIHPSVRLRDLSEIVRSNDVVLKYWLRPGPEQPATQTLLCTCKACGWAGPDPVMIDTADTFNPPRGDIPRCRQCGAYALSFHFAEAS